MRVQKLVIFTISTLIAGIFSLLFFINPPYLAKFNSNFIDLFFNLRGEKTASKDIIIIDIDERSLQKLGQWPWSRDKIAKIIKNLTANNIGIIGFDIVFAEEDRTSASKILKKLNIKTIKPLPDNDKILAKALQNSPSILGMIFNFENNSTINLPPPQRLIFIEKNKNNKNDTIPKAKGFTANIPILQNAAYSSGAFNMFADEDGAVRYVPLLFSYKNTLYPSLTLQMISAMLGSNIIKINYNELGVKNIQIANLTIPTDPFGRIFVNYKGKGKKYEYISAWDIYKNNIKKYKIKNKIALFGTSAPGLMDLRSTPFDAVFPGVEVHANVIDNIINQDIIKDRSKELFFNLLFIILPTIFIAISLASFRPLVGLFLSSFYIFGMFFLFYYFMFEKKELINFLYPFLSSIVTIFFIFFYKLFLESKQKELIKNKFESKVSKAVVEELLKNNLSFDAKEKEITIFFSDIRDFTTISESFTNPNDLLNYLNTYLSKMSEIVLKTKGTIDKFIGDAIMAYWNAPLNQKNHADLAVKCALLQIKSLKELNKNLNPPISIGIGIHTGVATVGEIGSIKRSDFTIIGDSVNLCSRLEGLTKIYGAKIIISQNTKDKLKKKYKIRELDEVLVKGKNKSIKIYEVIDFGKFSKKELIEYKIYLKALELYKNADFKEAKDIFEKLYKEYKDHLYKMYQQRCDEFLKKDIKDFNGVYRFVTK